MSKVKKWTVPESIISTQVRKQKRWYLNVDKRKASGGFGTVYSGNLSRWLVDKSNILKSSVKVAVKEQDVANHEHEVSMLRQLALPKPHPNIVPLLGAYVENNKGYLVVPMYKSSLGDWKGPCEDILMGVLSGLQYLETKGVVHCDIKPGNICVRQTEDGLQGVIIDFGLAKKDGEGNRGYTRDYLKAYDDFNESNRINVESLDHRYDLFCLSVVAGEVDASDGEKCLELQADLLDVLLPEPLLEMQFEQSGQRLRL